MNQRRSQLSRAVRLAPFAAMLLLFMPGSTTQSMKAAATAASTAFPPLFSIFIPVSLMRRCFEATIPFGAMQSLLSAPVHLLF